MPRLRLIHPWPAQGYADRLSGDDEVTDAGVRAMRPVAELYGEALAAQEVDNRVSEIRIFTAHLPRLSVVDAIAEVDPVREGFEMGFFRLPTAFLDLTPERRLATALEALHLVVVRLAEARGWDVDLDRCRDHVVARDHEFAWDGPWKSSPDRRLQARARFRMGAEGYGRARIEVADRASGEVRATSDEAWAFCTRQGFQRSARSLGWRGSDHVDLVPYDYVPATRGGRIVLLSEAEGGWRSDVSEGTAVRLPSPGDPAAPPLEVVGRGSGVTATEEPPKLVFIGGGPMNDVPPAYDRVFEAGMKQLCGPRGQAWWQEAGISGSILITYHPTGSVKVRGRMVGDELRVYVDRPLDSIRAGTPRRAAAATDVDSVVALLRRRTGLGPHPELPDG